MKCDKGKHNKMRSSWILIMNQEGPEGDQTYRYKPGSHTTNLVLQLSLKFQEKAIAPSAPCVASHTAEESSLAPSAENNAEWPTLVPSHLRAWLHPREVWGQLAFQARLHSNQPCPSFITHTWDSQNGPVENSVAYRASSQTVTPLYTQAGLCWNRLGFQGLPV